VLKYKADSNNWVEIEKIRNHLLKNKYKSRLIALIGNTNHYSASPTSLCAIEKRFSTSIKTGRILYNLVKHYNLRHIVEFGTYMGINTAYMAKANCNAVIFSVEISPEMAKTASIVFGQLNLTNIEPVNINYDTAIVHCADKFKNVDLFLISGNHPCDSIMRYFNYMKMYVKESSIIVISKIHWSKEMEKVWQKIQSDMDIRITIDLYDIGIVFFRKGIVKQDFIL
jgi:predicted O-methyltransferase YrrM